MVFFCACNQAFRSWHRHCYQLGDARALANPNRRDLMKLSMQTMAVAVALAFAGSAYAQQPTTPQPRDRAPAANESPEKRIDREHEAARDACKPLKGNAQDVCKKEADGKKKIAQAELKL